MWLRKTKNLCGWGTRVFASRKDNQSRSSHSSLITINESRYLMWQKAIKGVKFKAVPVMMAFPPYHSWAHQGSTSVVHKMHLFLRIDHSYIVLSASFIYLNLHMNGRFEEICPCVRKLLSKSIYASRSMSWAPAA